jgi:hypothetical protein
MLQLSTRRGKKLNSLSLCNTYRWRLVQFRPHPPLALVPHQPCAGGGVARRAEITLTQNLVGDNSIPPYAILSHT